MSQITLQRETSENFEIALDATVDPTSWVVEVALPASGARPTTWVAASWLGAIGAGRDWQATILSPTVGTTGSDIEIATAGTYTCYVRITADLETPVILAGTVIVQ